MMIHQSQIFYLILMVFQSTMSKARHNSLNEKHLRVITNYFGKMIFYTFNTSNQKVEIRGVLTHHIEALSKMYNFSYSFVPEIGLPVDDLPTKTGGITLMNKGGADYYLVAALGTLARSMVVDYAASWFEGSYYCFVPYPKNQSNAIASLKPLSFEVWILIFASALTTILSLHLLFNKRLLLWKSMTIAVKPTTVDNDVGGGINSFVWGNLVNQGQSISSSRLVVRLVAGSWCLVCFFLVQSYCSTLTSHLMAPNQKPIANSIHELVHLPGVKTTIDSIYGLRNLVMNAEIGNVKLMGDNLRRNPNLFCNFTKDCLETVKRDGYSAYCNTLSEINVILADDFKKTGTCHYYFINDILTSFFMHTLLPKHSPYTETISRGTLRLKEAGLYNEWTNWYIPSPWECKSNIKDQDNTLKKLSLSHLISAFVILSCGLLISTIAFILENFKKNCFQKSPSREH